MTRCMQLLELQLELDYTPSSLNSRRCASFQDTFDELLLLIAVAAVHTMLLQQPLQLLDSHCHELPITGLHRLGPA